MSQPRSMPARPLRRWPSRHLAALSIVLFAALALTSTSISPAVADDGQQPPAKPTGLEITTEAGSLDVSLDWDDVDGADDYLVRWRKAGPGNPLNEGEEVTTSEADITVESDGEWVVRLEACNDNGCGRHLAERFKVEPASDPTPEPTPESTPEPVTSVPGQPTGLSTASQQGSLDVSLDWDDVDGADSYRVRWRKKDGEFGDNQVTPTASTATITVSENGQWVVHVEACNDDGCGEHLSGEFQVVPAPEPTPEPDSAPATEDPVVEGASDDLSVSVVAFPTSPAVGQAVSMAASISNAPSGGQPSYKWEMDFGYWLAMSTNSTFSYMAEAPETWNIRVTVSYGSGESATSDPVTIEWGAASDDAEGSGSDAGTQSEEDSESTNQAPVVDEDATNHDAFTGTHNAPRGTLVQKSFDGIFSDPDGDTLAYTVTAPDDRDSLVSSLGINAAQDKVQFEYDAAGDWGAADPALPDPLTTTVTLTATDPDGATASITGKFSVDWDSRPVLSEATVFTQSETESDPASSVLDLSFDRTLDTTSVPAASQFTVKAFNADSTSAGTIAVSSVTVRGRFVVLALATVPADDLSLTVDYAAAADKPLTRSGGGDPAESFTGQAVTKQSLVSDPETARSNAINSNSLHQSATTLVSNTGRTAESNSASLVISTTSAFDHAQGFTTGILPSTLTAVNLALHVGNAGTDSTFSVSICPDSTGTPAISGCTALTPPDPLAQGFNTFSAPASGIDLAAGRTYYVVVDVATPGSKPLGLFQTASDAEETGAATGWGISDDRRWRSHSGSSWTNTETTSLMFSIAGHEALLVSNTGLGTTSSLLLDNGTDSRRDRAQRFTTGSSTDGYVLSSVSLHLTQGSTGTTLPTFSVSICTESSGVPDTSDCTALTAPSPLVDGGTNTFSAGGLGLGLDPSTNYFVLIDVTAVGTKGLDVQGTSSDDENTGGSAGWSLADHSLRKGFSATDWSTLGNEGNSLSIIISGGVAEDYDTNDDGLIEIGNAAQLNAVRWDTDGDGNPDSANVSDYAAAFPNAPSGMGCPSTGCGGYELDNDITLTGDWTPIGPDAGGWFRAIFNGNGHKIYGLRVNSPDQVRVGLFTGIGFGSGNGQVLSLGIIEPSIIASGSSTNVTRAGALAGGVHGAVKGVYVRGGTVTSSSTGTSTDLVLLGGLTGNLAHSGSIVNSYSTASVSSTAGNFNNTGGLVGMMQGNSATNRSTVTNSYAAGAVSNVSTGSDHSLGGLVGAMEATSGGVTFAEVTNGYYDSTESGQSDTGKGTAKTTAEMLELGPSDFGATTALIFAAREYPKLPFDSFGNSVTLLSNLGQARFQTLDLAGSSQGTAFIAGANTGQNNGFLLTAVQLVVEHDDVANPAAYTVAVHLDDSGSPGTQLGVLLNPGSLGADVDTFAAPSGGIALVPGTTYRLVVSVTSTDELNVDTTLSDGEDPVSASGWKIPDNVGSATKVQTMLSVLGVETRTARIESVRITSLPKIDNEGDKRPETYRQTDVIEVTVRWDENVVWNNPGGAGDSIGLMINVGGTNKTASLVSGGLTTGTSRELKFQYTVVAADSDTDGVFPNPDSSGDMVQLGGDATIKDTREGDPASRAHAALSPDPLHKVNGSLGADTAKPTIDTGTDAVFVSATAMTVNFNEWLAGDLPAAAAFTVTVDGASQTPAVVARDGHQVFLTLSQAVVFGQTVTLSYNPNNAGGTSRRLQDRSGNWVDAFTNQAVDNQTRQLVLGTVTLAEECAEPIHRGESVARRWDKDAGCGSVSRPGAYARYYTFAPGSDGTAITATLSSPDTDVWVYLWEGGQLVGSANSVGYARADLFSRITPGAYYIIEVTTSESAREGRFLLGLSGDGVAFDPPAECRDRPALHATVHGQWGWPCASSSHPGSYARYHTFTVTAEQNVQFEVWSSQVSNVRMNLRQGTQGSGRIIATSHHPPVPNGGVRARMTAYLIPGTYTVESVAVNAGRTGVLQFRTLQGPAQWQPPNGCVGTIPLDRNGNRRDATWAEPCWSNAHPGRHSRWYTFEVTNRSQVTLTLLYGGNHDRDGVNTYVYLRGGRNFTGWAIAENDNDTDNHPDGIWWVRRAGWHWTSSAIDRVWLDPGTYTIEATSHIKLGYTILKHPTGAGPFSITFQRMD